ncbi:MAG: hypothetical protein LCH76_07840 [Actinobacteria bacterium]|nr:hypothetical protein [Actinomycetota bacterium]
MTGTVSPAAPGQLGVAARPAEMLDYLGRLDAWLSQRRQELDSLDSQIQSTGRQAELTGDVTLALALWQAVKTRQDLILRTWDSGRVGQVELERLSGLIWGRLDTQAASVDQLRSMAVSLPEAGRLCDALVAQLRTRLNTDPNAEQQLIRLRNLRAQFERIRDQIGLEPPAQQPGALAKLDSLAQRAADLAGKRERGGDIGGLLGPLEIDAARYERDLIVTAAQRREARDLVTRARETHTALAARELAVRQVAAQAAATCWPLPVTPVPALAALGPIPNTRAALQPYLAQLDGYAAALATAHRDLAAAMEEVGRARDLLSALIAKAGALGCADDPTLTSIAALTAAQFDTGEPTVLPVVNELLAAYSARLDYRKTNPGSGV